MIKNPDARLTLVLSVCFNNIGNDNTLIGNFFGYINNMCDSDLDTSWNSLLKGKPDFIARIIDNLTDNQKYWLNNQLTSTIS